MRASEFDTPFGWRLQAFPRQERTESSVAWQLIKSQPANNYSVIRVKYYEGGACWHLEGERYFPDGPQKEARHLTTMSLPRFRYILLGACLHFQRAASGVLQSSLPYWTTPVGSGWTSAEKRTRAGTVS